MRVRGDSQGQAPLGKVAGAAHPTGHPGERRVLWASIQALSEPSELTEDEIFSKQPALQLQLSRILHLCKAEFCTQKQNVFLPGESA